MRGITGTLCFREARLLILNQWPLIHAPAKDGLDKFPKGVGVFLDNFQGLILA